MVLKSWDKSFTNMYDTGGAPYGDRMKDKMIQVWMERINNNKKKEPLSSNSSDSDGFRGAKKRHKEKVK